MFRSKTCRFWDTRLLKIGNTLNEPRMTLSTWLSQVPCIHWMLTSRPKFRSVSLWYKVVENRKCTKWSCIHWIQTPEAQISLCFSLRPAVFEIPACGKCTEWPQNDFKHLIVKCTLYTLNTNPRGPAFTLFRSTTSRLWGTRLSKIGIHRMTPEWP